VANADGAIAASEAPAAEIFRNLRRSYMAANIEIRNTKKAFCIFIDTGGWEMGKVRKSESR
jgi:hypothetical protein